MHPAVESLAGRVGQVSTNSESPDLLVEASVGRVNRLKTKRYTVDWFGARTDTRPNMRKPRSMSRGLSACL